MSVLYLIASLFSGAFITNFVPHFVHGISGKTFTTPFAKPRGIGPSSPTLNVIWGLVNLLAGVFLGIIGKVDSVHISSLLVFFIGFSSMALFLSKRLEKQHHFKQGE